MTLLKILLYLGDFVISWTSCLPEEHRRVYRYLDGRHEKTYLGQYGNDFVRVASFKVNVYEDLVAKCLLCFEGSLKAFKPTVSPHQLFDKPHSKAMI
jgi:hypothetical protein